MNINIQLYKLLFYCLKSRSAGEVEKLILYQDQYPDQSQNLISYWFLATEFG